MFVFISLIIGFYLGFKFASIGIDDERRVHKNTLMLLNDLNSNSNGRSNSYGSIR